MAKRDDYKGACPVCGQAFESRYVKRFCSIKCYSSSPERLGHLAAHHAVQKQKAKQNRKEISCLECGAKVFSKYESRKFCCKAHYRAYMAKRFDRHIANPAIIEKLQNYDEFLQEGELYCLVDGCGWHGHALSVHMNLAHGIAAVDFKKAAGFSLRTGVVSLPCHENLCQREGVGFQPGNPPVDMKGAGRRTAQYKSRERVEHFKKTLQLKRELALYAVRNVVCVGCQQEFTADPSKPSHSQKFCSIPCRTKHYVGKVNARLATLTCSACNGTFLGKRAQELRATRGMPVTCSVQCRAFLNSRKPRHHKAAA